MATAHDIMTVAASYIGTHEDPLGSNNVFANTDYYGHPVFGPDYPWCCAFVWDIFRIAGASDLFYYGQRTAYCPTVAAWGAPYEVPYNSAQYGDIVLFDWDGDGVADHIGLVLQLNSDGSLETIEGNTSDADHSNGGYVLQRTRYRGSVCMLIRPQYDNGSSSIMIECKQIQLGDTGKDVKRMQALLRGRGFRDRQTKRLPEVDGVFGPASERALIYFQEKLRLEVDGVCGPATWAALQYAD